jgi:hypothetical protein
VSNIDISQQIPSAGERSSLETLCNRLEHMALPGDYEILEKASLTSGHPWAFLTDVARSDPGSVGYYRYLYGLARLVNPSNILEIGTGFGLSGAAFVQGAPNLRKFISLDLGVLSKQYDVAEQGQDPEWELVKQPKEQDLIADGRNIDFARKTLERMVQEIGSQAKLRFYQVNTQPIGSDNFDWSVSVPRWSEVEELVNELGQTPIDLLFIDGKHTDDGLYHDFKSFFPYVRPGGIIFCDDLHDDSYPYEWAGQTLDSFNRILKELSFGIEDSYIWQFPQLPDWYDREPILRPFGLIRKRGRARLGFLVEGHEPLFVYELDGFEDNQIIQWLGLLKNYPALCSELEALGLDDHEIVRRLRLAQDHQTLLSALEAFGLDDHEVIQRLGLFENYPVLCSYLTNHPALVSDLESVKREFGRLPLKSRIGLALHLIWKSLRGEYNLRGGQEEGRKIE